MSNQTNEVEVRNNDIARFFDSHKPFCHFAIVFGPTNAEVELDKKQHKFTFSSFAKKARN